MQETQIAEIQAARARTVSINTIDEPAGRNAASSSSQPGLVDTRTLGKPEVFKGDANEFADWCFIFRSYMSCINVGFTDLMERAERSGFPIPNRALTESDRALSSQLYFVLVMLLRGRALDIAYNAGISEGIEAYRKLYQQYHPRVASRYVGSLSMILNTKFGVDLEAELESFDKTVRRYELESGKNLDDELLVGIVIHGLQDQATRDHIIRNASRLTSYNTLRDELIEMARTNRVLQSMPTPMDIGAVPNAKGKGKKGGQKGSGKGSKGTQKGDPKGKGKSSPPKDNPNKDKVCYYCNKTGHLKVDCRKRIADEKAGKTNAQPKAKGIGKHRPNAASPDEEPEPISAYPEEPCIAAAVENSVENNVQEILVDTGAGNHLFVKGFDGHATHVSQGNDVGMVTVTGQPLSTGPRKKSTIQTDAGKFTVEYHESDKINFSVMSAGKAAQKGTWTVIGPDVQVLIPKQNAGFIKDAVDKTPNKLELRKKRGVYWLPVSLNHVGSPTGKPLATVPENTTKPSEVAGSTAPKQAGSTAHSDVGSPTPVQDVVAAVKAVKKAVTIAEDAEEAGDQGQVVEGQVASSSSGGQDLIPSDEPIRLGEPPQFQNSQDSPKQRKFQTRLVRLNMITT